jgi:serine/threonine protein kinase
MFKMNPDNAGFEAIMPTTTGQTFSLIMEYLQYGSLMQRLDVGLAKSKESPPTLRCGWGDWKDPAKMFIGVDDWELKLHLALGIARGIRAMHKGGVWHRDLKSSNVLIQQYHPTEVCPQPFPLLQWMLPALLFICLHSHHPSQDVLAVAAARQFGAYPYDMMDPESPESSTPFPPATPRTPGSPIHDRCRHLGLSDHCLDHAASLWFSYFHFRDRPFDLDDNVVAAACVHLAEQANVARSCCTIESISSAFNCTQAELTQVSSKLSSLLRNNRSYADNDMAIPVFYACVCDFGLSKVCSLLDAPFIDCSNIFGSLPASWTRPKTTQKAPGPTWLLKFLRRSTDMLRARLLLLQHPSLRHPREWLQARPCPPRWGQARLKRAIRRPLPLPARRRELNGNSRITTITETFGRLDAFCTSSPRTGARGASPKMHAPLKN